VAGRLIGVVGLKLARANLMSGMSELNSFLCFIAAADTCPGNRMTLGLSLVSCGLLNWSTFRSRSVPFLH